MRDSYRPPLLATLTPEKHLIAVPLKIPVLPLRLRLWASRIFFTAAGTGSELILRFVRTVILAHLLVPAEFGAAMAITLVIFASELISDIGIDRFILNKPQDDGRVLATVHTLQIARSVIVAFGIVLCASPMARLFGIPQYTSSFMLTSVVILIRGFNHLGVKQAQRDYNYRPEAISLSVSQMVTLVATAVTAFILRDHRAILVAFGIEALVYVIVTHRLAASPFSVRMDPIIGREALAYGLPLIANGIILALMSQADRMLVGYYFGVEALADYAVILNIAVVPLASVYRIVASIALAMLARDREVPRRREVSYLLVAWGFTLVGLIYACGMSLGLDIVVPLIFGKAYTVADSLRLLVSLIVFMRVLRWAPSSLLMTLGKTKHVALANMIAGLGFVGSVVIVVFFRDMSSILAGVLIGEIASTAVFHRSVVRQVPAVYRSIERSLIGGILSAAMIAGGILLLPERSLASRLMLAVLFCAPATLITWGLLRCWKRREAIIAFTPLSP